MGARKRGMRNSATSCAVGFPWGRCPVCRLKKLHGIAAVPAFLHVPPPLVLETTVAWNLGLRCRASLASSRGQSRRRGGVLSSLVRSRSRLHRHRSSDLSALGCPWRGVSGIGLAATVGLPPQSPNRGSPREPASTLLGLRCEPGWILGSGPQDRTRPTKPALA